jgi:hypothetical protein
MDARTRVASRVALAAFAIALLLPGTAFAQDSVAHRTVVSRVTGVQLAEQLVGEVRDVQLGSTGATLSLDVEGKRQPIHIDYSNLAGTAPTGTGDAGGGIGGLARLFAIPVVGGVALKVASMLSRLGRQ